MTGDPESPSSSYPLSLSPTFWSEAINTVEQPPPTHVDTSLRYLRNDVLSNDSYLANPEYAPNKFGDIGDYMRKKEIKVQTQNRDIALASIASGTPQIFKGLSFYINGNTQPPMEEIRKMILQRGGEVRPVLRNKGMVNYIIAPMLTQSKFKQFERYKVVKEGWILESCKEGRLLDWSRWKLQPEGGWEAQGRQGLEGFLKADVSSTATPIDQDIATSASENQDAARLMRDKEWRLKNTAEHGNKGGFIDGYYQNSRLHHLSTWKAELRVLVAAAQQQSEERAFQSALVTGEKTIFHVDFDCFFVSCGLATRPHLKGKPVVVCHSQMGKSISSTSEIASASYEARAKGVKNGMGLGRARQLALDLETIPYEFETYKKFSLAFYTVLMGYADELQAVSVDEALIDVTSAVAARAAAPQEASSTGDPAVEIAQQIRDEVRGLTQCEVSIGIAHNILLAKLGTRRAKPAGVFHVLPSGIESLLAPLDVEDLPSIGYSMRAKIEERFSTTTCGELLQYPKGAFKALLGPKTGEMVYEYIRGVDSKKLEPHKERKSISAEMNYGIRFQTQEQAETCIADLAAEVSKRMKQVNAKGRLLTLKVMSRHPDAPVEPPKFLGHGVCETSNKSTPIGKATDDPETLALESVKLLRGMKLDPKELRGVGIQMTKLDSDSSEQGTLSFGKRKQPPDSIDPDFLAALPEDLREEVKRDHSRSKHAAATLPEVLPQEVKRDSRSKHAANTAALPEDPRQEVKRDSKSKHPTAHITRQLRPRVKTHLKAGAVANLPLYNAWNAVPVDLTDEVGDFSVAELRDLGIDPEVFEALPPEMQKEIVDEERRKHGRQKLLHRPADHSRLKARKHTVSPTPPEVSLPPRPSLLKATSLEDVKKTITLWIDSRKGGPPASKDAERVKTYLVKCLDEGMGLKSVETVIEVLRHMKLEVRDEDAEWMSVWTNLVDAVNQKAIRRFGAPFDI